MLTRRATASV